MKIAIFSDTFPPQTNGVANVAYQSSKNLAEAGHQVMVFTVAKKTKNPSSADKTKNLQIVRLPSVPTPVYSGERATLPLGLSLAYLKKFRPNIIHIHTPFPVGWEGIMAAKILNVPLVGTHHTFFDHYLKHVKLDFDWMKNFSWKYTNACYNFCDLVLNPSRALTEAMKHTGLKSQAQVLRNAVDTELFRPPSAEEKTKAKKRFNVIGQSVVYMGRLSYEKNIDQVLQAFVLMLKDRPALNLMIIGGGPETARLKELADGLKIKNSVIFTGFLYGPDLVEALWANDVFLTASQSENMPLSVLEVMAAGLPLVIVKEKGLAELIEENQNGFFAKTGDPADMARQALKILTSPDLIQRFSTGSRNLAEQCSREKTTKKLISIYQNLL